MAKVSLPSNVEAERSVLGAMLLSANACNIAIASLTEDSFPMSILETKSSFMRWKILASMNKSSTLKR